MPGRHQMQPSRSKLRWLAGVSLAAVGGLVALSAAIGAGSAGASTPDPNYHPGSDSATFGVLGVTDANCFVSTGGTEVWIKPGDKIVFQTSLVGIDVAALDIGKLLGPVAGLNVTATIDKGKPTEHQMRIQGGKSVTYPGQGEPALAAGDHSLDWTATGVSLVSGLVTVPLQSDALKTGASLSWAGKIHVTDTAAKCKLAVGTPKVGVSAGPVKVTVPPVNVGVSEPRIPGVTLPKLPSLPHVGGTSSNGGSKPTEPVGSNTAAGGNELPVPARVVPRGDGQGVYGDAGGYGAGLLPQSNSGGQATNPDGAKPSTSAAAPVVQQDSTGKHKNVDLAASKADSTGQFSVILAIVAIIALSVVAATYARLYLLRRS